MPVYDYVCKQCTKKFTLMITLSEYERGVKCPTCKSKKVEQRVSSFVAQSPRKS